MAKIKLKRGYNVNLDKLSLADGELAYVIDTGNLYIGNQGKNLVVSKPYRPANLNKTLPYSKNRVNETGQIVAQYPLTKEDIPSLPKTKIIGLGSAASVNLGISEGSAPILDQNGYFPSSVITAPKSSIGTVTLYSVNNATVYADPGQFIPLVNYTSSNTNAITIASSQLVTILESGIYYIYYYISNSNSVSYVTLSSPSSGWNMAASKSASNIAPITSFTSSSCILKLNVGETFGIKNLSSSKMTITGMGAGLSITKLGQTEAFPTLVQVTSDGTQKLQLLSGYTQLYVDGTLQAAGGYDQILSIGTHEIMVFGPCKFQSCTCTFNSVKIGSDIGNCNHMFSNCPTINMTVDIPNNITACSGMFSGCTSFNQPMTIPSSVTNCSNMFSGCTSFNLPMTIPTSVTDCSGMFSGCTSFNQPMTIPSSVTNCSNIFSGCTSYNLPITIPSSVTNCSGMLSGCTSYNLPITIPSSVVDASYLLQGCKSFNYPVTIPKNCINAKYFLSQNVDVVNSFSSPITIESGVQNLEGFLENCNLFNYPVTIPNTATNINRFLANFNSTAVFNQNFTIPNSVISANYVLYGQKVFDSNFVIGSKTNDISYALSFTNYNKPITISSAVRSAVRFLASNSVFNSPLTLNTPASTCNYYNLLQACSSFNQPLTLPPNTILNLMLNACSNFNSTITFMDPQSTQSVYGLLYRCTKYNLPITLPTNSTDCSYVFYNCVSFNQTVTIPATALTCQGMFSFCYSLTTTPDIPPAATNVMNMFESCSNLTTLSTYNYNLLTNTPSQLVEYSACYKNCTRITSPITYDNIPAAWKEDKVVPVG